MTLCPNCNLDIKALVHLTVVQKSEWYPKGSSKEKLPESSNQVYRCPTCRGVIAGTKEQADDFFVHGLEKRTIRGATRFDEIGGVCSLLLKKWQRYPDLSFGVFLGKVFRKPASYQSDLETKQVLEMIE